MPIIFLSILVSLTGFAIVAQIQENPMANICENTLTITGPTADVTDFYNRLLAYKHACNQSDGELRFGICQLFVPMPEKPEPDWYVWAKEHWGSKWGDYSHGDIDMAVFPNDPTHAQMCVDFDSAWVPPFTGFKTISKLFPTLTFNLEFIIELAEGGQLTIKYGDFTQDFPMPTDQAKVETLAALITEIRERADFYAITITSINGAWRIVAMRENHERVVVAANTLLGAFECIRRQQEKA